MRPKSKALRPQTLVLLGLLIATFWIFSPVDLFRRHFDQREAKRVLSGAKDLDQLRQAVGGLGIVFELKDKSWVAIRYVDSHYGSIYSCAVALDSKGRWFYSGRHFCGRFSFYEEIARQDKLDAAIKPSDPELFAIANAADVDEAISQLLKIGFHE